MIFATFLKSSFPRTMGRIVGGLAGLTLLLPGTVPAQSPTDSPTTVELREIVRADQAERSRTSAPTPETAEKGIAEDLRRRQRVAALLRDDKLRTGEDFAHAALVFQHGETPDDFLTAHELAILATLNGRNTTLIVLAEDRFLRRIGRKQRFGTQFSVGADGRMTLDPVSEGRPTDVTDALRADMAVPTPAQWRERPNAEAYSLAMPTIEARRKRGTDPKRIVTESRRPWAIRLRQWAMATTAPPMALEQTLKVYEVDELATPEDFRNAAIVLGRSSDAETLLLAHELAVVALCRGDRAALPVATRTLDAFLTRIGGPPRYRPRPNGVRVTNAALRDLPLAAAAVRAVFLGKATK
ncbi:MAG: hypothetical protein SFU56_22185 [Capsulimonadales bacterium]|nr:hypothetical protein [Capsulimonadales bacterium]